MLQSPGHLATERPLKFMKTIKNMILHNLKSPHKIPIKIVRKIIFLYKKANYNFKAFELEQNKRFVKSKLDRVEGKKKLKKIKENYKFLEREMSSEHEVLFSSISIAPKIKINNILEIGTFDGVNAFLLSKLFQNSKIETIDLKSNEIDFTSTYKRNKNVEKFINLRDSLLSKIENIKFIELNSVKLIFSQKKYDLIWIDGAHGYPVCCIDIINSVKLLNRNGIIMVDDILIENNENDKMYDSIAGFETLKELEKNNIIKLDFFYKRLDADSNANSKKISYVALVRLLN